MVCAAIYGDPKAGSLMLDIIGLSKTYPTGTTALENVSFTVDQPRVVAIIGPSGAGKSTLIRCINRLVPVSYTHLTLPTN